MNQRGLALENRIQRIRGRVAANTAVEQYSVYSLNASTPAGGLLLGTPDQTNFNASNRRMTKRDAVEAQPFDLQVHHLIADIRSLEIGNVLVQEEGDSTRFCFVQHRMLRENVFVIVDRNATLRFTTSSAEFAQNDFGVDSGESSGQTPETEYFVAWNGSSFYLSNDLAVTPFMFPVGLQQTARVAPNQNPGQPIGYGEGRYTIYIPPTPGITLDATTRVVIESDRYELLQVLTDAGSGFRGSVAIARLH